MRGGFIMGLDLNHGDSWTYYRYDNFIEKVGKIYGAIPNRRDEGILEIETPDDYNIGEFNVPAKFMFGNLEDKRFKYPKGVNLPPLCIITLLNHSNYKGSISVEICKSIYKELLSKKKYFYDEDEDNKLDKNYVQFMDSLKGAINANEDLEYS
jgi:hypothetical protein